MGYYVRVAEDDNEEPIEIPLEEDGSLLFSTLTAQFPGCTGLRYKGETGNFRGIRLVEGKFYPPENSWQTASIYYCVLSKENKRKSDDTNENSMAKTKRMDVGKPMPMPTTDLVVLGLPHNLKESTLRSYFQSLGEVSFVSIKKNNKTGNSKGFGFVRFVDYETQTKALTMQHFIENRPLNVKIPDSKYQNQPTSVNKGRIFIGRITEEVTITQLREHFSKFGEVVNVYIPKPFRAFAFVTFQDAAVAQSLIGQDHVVNGVSITIGEATIKDHLSVKPDHLPIKPDHLPMHEPPPARMPMGPPFARPGSYTGMYNQPAGYSPHPPYVPPPGYGTSPYSYAPPNHWGDRSGDNPGMNSMGVKSALLTALAANWELGSGYHHDSYYGSSREGRGGGYRDGPAWRDGQGGLAEQRYRENWWNNGYFGGPGPMGSGRGRGGLPKKY